MNSTAFNSEKNYILLVANFKEFYILDNSSGNIEGKKSLTITIGEVSVNAFETINKVLWFFMKLE